MTPDEDEDTTLARAFQNALSTPPSQIEASWSRFSRHTLPEKQAWVAYQVTLRHAHARLKTMTRWSHRNR